MPPSGRTRRFRTPRGAPHRSRTRIDGAPPEISRNARYAPRGEPLEEVDVLAVELADLDQVAELCARVDVAGTDAARDQHRVVEAKLRAREDRANPLPLLVAGWDERRDVVEAHLNEPSSGRTRR